MCNDTSSKPEQQSSTPRSLHLFHPFLTGHFSSSNSHLLDLKAINTSVNCPMTSYRTPYRKHTPNGGRRRRPPRFPPESFRFSFCAGTRAQYTVGKDLCCILLWRYHLWFVVLRQRTRLHTASFSPPHVRKARRINDRRIMPLIDSEQLILSSMSVKTYGTYVVNGN